MRRLAIVALLTAPVALLAWVAWRGQTQGAAELVLKVEPAAAATPDAALRALFDGELGGVQRSGEVTLYDEQSLFEYIDGAAPVYLERHFRKLATAELKSAASELTCDIYDMREPQNAVSIFEKERSTTAKAVDGWPEAVAGSMSFVFHRGPYYVKLTAFDAVAEAALPLLARALKGKIP